MAKSSAYVLTNSESQITCSCLKQHTLPKLVALCLHARVCGLAVLREPWKWLPSLI